MQTAIITVAHALDIGRSQALRLTMSIGWLRALFVHRASRLMAMYLVAFVAYLATSLFFPLWVLVLGPVLYGVPHIFASIRYVHYTLSGATQATSAVSAAVPDTRRQAFSFLCGLAGAMAAIRILAEFKIVEMPELGGAFSLPEAAAMVATLGGCAWIYRRRPLRVLLASAVIAPIVAASWYAPFWIAGILILAHNFVAFAYWILAARSPAERRVALVASAMFVAATLAIFMGWFDGLYARFTPQGELLFAGLNYADLGPMITAGAGDYRVWFHAVVAYAFGQALHYFVWLKAIPDQQHHHEVPTSFRQSYRLLLDDFGPRVVMLMIVASAAMIAVWALMAMPAARGIYFAVAAFHGYLEIAGLSLADFTTRDRVSNVA